MPLLNYTTAIPAFRSLEQIHKILVAAGAMAIMHEYDATKEVKSISFKAETEFGIASFELPCNVAAAQLVLNAQAKAGAIPKRYINDADQARRIAWRILKDWLEAQLAIITIGMAKMDQVFLPYAMTPQGDTFYEAALKHKMDYLALTDAKPEF